MITLNNTIVFEEILAGLVAVLILGPVGIFLAQRFGFIDHPGLQEHKQHQFPIPLAGGLILGIALIFLLPVFKLWELPGFAAIAFPAAIIFAFGLLDDHNKKFPSRLKLLGQIAAAVVFVSLGEQIRILKPGFLGLDSDFLLVVNILITILWLVGITNAFNFIDSMDGLATGVGATAFAFLILATINANQLMLAQFAGLLFGILLGLNFYNAPPARMFIGDSGAMTIGFLLAAVSLFYTPPGVQQASSWFVPILIMGIPIFDTVLVVFSRMRRGLPVYKANRDHTYHRLTKMGLNSNRAVLLIIIAALILDCVAIVALSQSAVLANVIFGTCLLVGLVLVLVLDSRLVMSSGDETLKAAFATGSKE
jgi:UDP-GlcNAc:undecaprenyl-phosphate/decaprenyl-phosphate GlcNAc-1-phosphate transferase